MHLQTFLQSLQDWTIPFVSINAEFSNRNKLRYGTGYRNISQFVHNLIKLAVRLNGARNMENMCMHKSGII